MAKTGSDGKGKSESAGQERPRIGKPFHRPARAARGRVRSIAQNNGFAEPDVLLRWAEAVGPALSGICQPVKVSYSGSIGATLLVRTDSGHAPAVEHSKMQIIERINSFYGYRAISRLKITQATGQRGFAEAQVAFDGPAAPGGPTRAATKAAAALASDIKDPGLRAAVSRMGAWVLSKTPTHSNTTDQESSS
ncbi:MAG: DUF721 domain-containing protein [Pseudomonadota bacterium]